MPPIRPRVLTLVASSLGALVIIVGWLTTAPAAQSTRPAWVGGGQVWHFGLGGTFPCDGCDSYINGFYSDIAAAGATATSWNDIRMQRDWRQRVARMADQNRSRGVRTIGTISNVWFWQEYQHTAIPEALRRTAIVDPFGNRRVDDLGWFPGDATWYSLYDQAWADYLISCLTPLVDARFDGILIDDAVLMGEQWDFRPALVADFNAYLAARLSPREQDDLARTHGFASFAEFDYAKVWRDRLPAGTAVLTAALWNQRWALNMPLHREYSAFLRARTHDVLARVVATVKDYARRTQGRELPIAFNLGSLEQWTVPYVDLIDYVDNEFSYSTADDWAGVPSYFPAARSTSVVKVLGGMDRPAKIFTNLAARAEIGSRKEQNTGLYRTLIADAFAPGGAFYVEERAHGIQTNFAAIAPSYRFVVQQPELFPQTPAALVTVAVLQLWEQYEPHPRPSINGTSALLSDDGWQFDILFSGEDVQPDYPGVSQLLSLDRLRRYPAVVLPRLAYCARCGLGITPAHARLLLDYVAEGGQLVVVAGDTVVDDLLRRNPSAEARTFYQRLRSAPATAPAAGGIVRLREDWPAAYFRDTSREIRAGFSDLLEATGVTHPLRLAGQRRAVAAFAARNGNTLIVQLVNYDYNRTTDRTASVTDLRLTLEGVSVVRATAHMPGAAALPLPLTVGDRNVSVALPQIDPWTVVSFDLATAP